MGWVWGVGCEVGVLFTCQTVVSKSMCNASLRMGLYVGVGARPPTESPLENALHSST